MNVAAALATIWLFIGIQILFVSLYILIRRRVPIRLRTRGAIIVVVFWPDYLARVIRHSRHIHAHRKTKT